MRSRILLSVGLGLLGLASSVHAQDVIWRPAKAVDNGPAVTLGQPRTLTTVSYAEPPPRIVRGQEPPPPPPYVPPGGPAPVFPTPTGPAATNLYNQGPVTSDADLGGFWARTGDRLKRCWDD